MPRTVLTLLAVAAVAAVAVAASGCGAADDAAAGGGGGPTVVAAAYPVAYAVRAIAAPGTTVVDLTPAGAEPHDVELSARDVAAVRSADVVLYLGGGFQPAVEDAVDGAEGEAVDLLPPGTSDPHVWLDPVAYAALARRIGAALGREAAAARFATRLDRLDRAYRRGLASCDRRTIVTSHAAFGRLAARYGLEQVALTGPAPEAEPSAGDIEALVGRVDDSGATTVFTEPLVAPDLADTVAHEAGVTTAVLDPVESAADGGDYGARMRANLHALETALGCRPPSS